jgi:cytochrome c biogenesis protein CcmG/thiol:disulfide interchange protein DsbE
MIVWIVVDARTQRRRLGVGGARHPPPLGRTIGMNQAQPADRSRLRLTLLVPLIVFAALAAIFLLRLQSGVDSDFIPSALVGKPAPKTDLPPLAGLNAAAGPVGGLSGADFAGNVTVVNVFASWCVPCRDEHPQLVALAGDARIRLVGINYKDSAGNALRFLGEMGNPYRAVGVDQNGRAAIDWGVYGVPETFIVGRDGIVRYKFVGPIDVRAMNQVIRPEIEKALAG